MGHQKVDLRKSCRAHFCAPEKEFEDVTLSPASYLMVDGKGPPGGPAYVAALELLYPVAYALKFHSKIELGRDYVVPPLEGLWWSDALDAFTANRRDEWQWTMMSMVPDWLTRKDIEHVLAAVASKKPELDLARLRFTSLEEGRCFQKLHLGSFADEAPVLAHLHDELMPAAGLTFNGPHHEVYLSNPRKVAPEKLRTILRQPVKRSSS